MDEQTVKRAQEIINSANGQYLPGVRGHIEAIVMFADEETERATKEGKVMSTDLAQIIASEVAEKQLAAETILAAEKI